MPCDYKCESPIPSSRDCPLRAVALRGWLGSHAPARRYPIPFATTQVLEWMQRRSKHQVGVESRPALVHGRCRW